MGLRINTNISSLTAQNNLFRLFKEFGFGYRVLRKVVNTVSRDARETRRCLRQLDRLAANTGLTRDTLLQRFDADELPAKITKSAGRRLGTVVLALREVTP